MLITFLFQNISLLYFQDLRIAYVSKDLQMSVKFDMINTFKFKKKSKINFFSYKKTFYLRNESTMVYFLKSFYIV